MESAAVRHSRKCSICSHPERRDIEEDFIHWMKPSSIARIYDVPRVAIYRHARAAGLFEARRAQTRSVLDKVIERGAEKPVTANHVIRAVRAYACLTDDNHWIEPTRRVIYTIEQPAGNGAAPVRLDLESRAAVKRVLGGILIDTAND